MSTDDTPAGGKPRKLRQPEGGVEIIDGVKFYRPTFVPKAKHPCIELQLNLRTEASYRSFQAVYDPVQKTLYHLYATLPIACRSDRRVLDEGQKEVETLIAEISSEISDELERCKVVLKNVGAGNIKKYYHEEVIFVESLTPMMSRFLGLIVRMDEMLVAIDTVHLADCNMRENEHTQLLKKWRNRIARFNRTISMTHARVMGDADRQANEAARQARAALEGAAKAAAPKKVLAGKAKQKQQRKAGKVLVKVPKPEPAVTDVPPAEAAPVEPPAALAAPAAVIPADELVDAAA